MQIEHGVNASTSTIQRRLREAGLNGRKARSTPHLTARHKKAHLEFARVHKDWTAEQWPELFFSDESRFCLNRSDGQIYVRRMSSEEFKESCIKYQL